MIEMEEAVRIVMDRTQLTETTTVDLMDALGRRMSADVVSDLNMPPFDKSTMDGFALLAADVKKASAENPVALEVVEEIPAGQVPTVSITQGNASRIMTGAPVPAGADSVVMVEETEYDPASTRVKVMASADVGQNIAWLGEDVVEGQVVLPEGTVVRPIEVGILAAMGVVSVPVYRQPTVGIAATGSEVVEPSVVPSPGQIRNSNGYSMSAQVLRAGASASYRGIVPDDATALKDAIASGLDEFDIFLLSGGVSAGAYDLVPGAMQACGVEILFDRIRMKPGKPLTFGVRGDKLIFGLPGNPVSSMVGIELLVRPAIRKMQGIEPAHRLSVPAVLGEPFRQRPGRKQYVPAIAEQVDGRWQCRGVGHSGSADLFSLSRANSLFVAGAEVESLPAGADIELVLLTEW